jgi:hypothetical protein
MEELRRIYCKTLNDLPNLEGIGKELKIHDRIRIEYDIHANFIFSYKVKQYIKKVQKKYDVQVNKGDFKELEFYNIYNLYSDSELLQVTEDLEKAVKSYRLTSEKLIRELEEKYDHSFTDSEKSIYSILEKLEADNYQLSKKWSYRFHGGDVCFSNSQTGQIVDINLKFGGQYGVLDLWFFQYFMETTDEFYSCSLNFEENIPKLIQSLNFLKHQGKVKLIRSELFESEKLIWIKENGLNTGKQGS